MATTCYIYRCSAKANMYIYLPEKDNESLIPESLRKSLGILDFAMELELDEGRRLAQANPAEVIKQLETQGFYLQMPPSTSIEQLLAEISQQATGSANRPD